MPDAADGSSAGAFDEAVRRHDERLASLGLALWVGSEPTFTDRRSQQPEWLHTALGGDKFMRAQALLAALARRMPGAAVLRSVGRRYPGEEQPRWCLGLYRRRDGAAVWDGPPDPLLAAQTRGAVPDAAAFAAALATELAQQGWRVEAFAEDERVRVVAHRDAAAYGFEVGCAVADDPSGAPAAFVELPALDDVPLALVVLRCLAQAARASRLEALVIGGHPPPVGATVELTAVTPDPAVVEVNAAPSASACEFLARSRAIYAAAAEQGLAPYRLYFNGTVADSGGGGQITLGGPSPEASPFIAEPLLLPRLVRFFNHHPSLSYLYAHDFVGCSGQSVRADERAPHSLDELALALDLVECAPAPTPELTWQTLAPFLCDATGNGHRAEINIEKLANHVLPGRGRQGLVEFRALRMQHSPERATALACLLRAIVALLATAPYRPPLVDWGRDLHARFALPFYLEQDLRGVLDALDAAGLGLGPILVETLLRDEFRAWAQVPLPGATLELRRALEFWPLLGDAASPEQGGTSRLVDASTARVELRLRPAGHTAPGGSGRDWRAWQLRVYGTLLPMREERDAQGELEVYGLRYRSFVPTRGLHPSLGAQMPVTLQLRHPGDATEWLVTLHEWRPDGAAYAGLPADLDDAACRRAERVAVREVEAQVRADDATMPAPTARAEARCIARAGAVGAYAVDLRRLVLTDGPEGQD